MDEDSNIIQGGIIISPLLRAKDTFDIAMQQVRDDLTRDGCIQRFEYCFELSWKMMKRILAYRGIVANSPREVFRLAAAEQLIAEPTVWFGFLEQRNNTSHNYNKQVSQEIFDQLPTFQQELTDFVNTIKMLK